MRAHGNMQQKLLTACKVLGARMCVCVYVAVEVRGRGETKMGKVEQLWEGARGLQHMHAHKSTTDSSKDEDSDGGGNKSKDRVKRTLIYICIDCQSNAIQTHLRTSSNTRSCTYVCGYVYTQKHHGTLIVK